ncbi:hypothetical protein [Streptomyces fulvoviolaceus]|uniref:hypothetical protein n=1 Tax=Streptomyces fulvoviolaceus TaxID=285535 RepID=UPI000B273ACB|nr:hypothetical protein [Streptomyces fulvoviolaceus]
MATLGERGASGAAGVVPTVVGLGVGVVVVVVATSRYRGADLWPVWSALALS